MYKKLSIVLTFSLVLLYACSSTNNIGGQKNNTLASKEKEEGWQLLFDGTTTNGWHTYGRSTVGQAWKISDGVLYFDTTRVNGRRTGGGDITTDKEYENFHLKLEWKIAPGGNSGIIFLVHEDTAKYRATYSTGVEMQVIDNNGHADAKITKHRAGDLYDLVASSKETVKPLTEWNLAEIKLNKGKLDLYLNGENIVSTTMWDEGWKALVAGSKFKTWDGFAKFTKGKIALQDHGDMVWFRNIKIKEL
ncbi:MAG TPA: DUF1080 domain-containing protein [Flavisolibacter sp.]|nr:DUF1080 domain-containing protein [Flavisolibacter sp.]